MYRISKNRPWPPTIDLSTVRETLAYIQDDMERMPELKGVAEALRATLHEIDRVEPKPTISSSPFAARFLPWRGV